MLDYVEVRAPFAGVISRRLADAGDFASPGKPLVEIENPEVLRFEADVPEALIEKIRRGEDLSVRIPSIDGEIKGPCGRDRPLGGLEQPDVSCADRPAHCSRIASRPIWPHGHSRGRRAQLARASVRSWLCEARWRWFSSLRTARFGFVLSRLANDFDEIEVLSGVAQGERVVSEGASGLSDDQPVSVLQ